MPVSNPFSRAVLLAALLAASTQATSALAAPIAVSPVARLAVQPASGGVRGVVSGGYLFTSNPFNVFDVRDPLAPALVTSLAGVGGTDVALYGNWLYQVGTTVNVLDVRDPRAPVAVNVGAIPAGFANKVAISGSLLYVASGQAFYGVPAELRVYSLVDPTAPALVGTLALPASPTDLAISGATAYLADQTGGLRVVDVSVPSAPREVASLAVGNARGVAVSGNYAYVTVHEDYCDEEYCGPLPGSLVVVDVTGAACPRVVGSVPTRKAAEDIVVVGRYAYVVEQSIEMNGTRQDYLVADVTVPTSPVLAQYSTAVYFGRGLAVAGASVFVPTANNLFVFRTVEAAPPPFVCPVP